MLYILNGFTEDTAMGGQLVTKEVRFVAPLKHFFIEGDYISYGGIPINASSLIRVEDEVAGDMAFVNFIERVSDAFRGLSILVLSGEGTVSLLDQFIAQTDELVNRFKFTLAASPFTVDVDQFRKELTLLTDEYLQLVTNR